MSSEILDACDKIVGAVTQIRAALAVGSGDWAFPVGTTDAPVEDWYCAQFHTWKGGTTGHTGLDLNLDRSPWGDVDRGFPIWAIASGQVWAVGYSPGWVGVVVIRHQHDGAPLWVRYAHLAPDITWVEGQIVAPGDQVGVIGNYTSGLGGDHLHCDMARDAFEWNWYRTPNFSWVDPVPILKAHLDPDKVDAMLRKGTDA